MPSTEQDQPAHVRGRVRSIWHTVGATCLALSAGCHRESAAFVPGTGPSVRNQAALVEERLRSAPLPRRNAVALVSEDGRVAAYDLDTRTQVFAHAAHVVQTPFVAGPLFVVPEAERVVIYAIDSAGVALDIGNEGMFVAGADSEGELSAVALTNGSALHARSRLLLFEGTRLRADVRADVALGAPAVRAGLVVVPHARVHVSALDADGRELLRHTLRNDVASAAFSAANGVYFGLAAAARFDGLLARQTERFDPTTADQRERARFAPPVAHRRALPGQPTLLTDTGVAPAPPESAAHRVHLSFALAADDSTVHAARDNVYFSFYREVLALGETLDAVHWAHTLPSDVLASAATTSGVLVAEQRGVLTGLDASGAVGLTLNLPFRPIAARFSAESFAIPQASAHARSPVQALHEAALDADARLLPVQLMVVRGLAAHDDAEATAALLDVCEQKATGDGVRREACALLGKRSAHSVQIAAALTRHYDFLRGLRSPAIESLARAAGGTADRRLVPLLLNHLEDPATPLSALPAILDAVRGLAKTGGSAGGQSHDPLLEERLQEFVTAYHTTGIDPHLSDAAAQALDVLSAICSHGEGCAATCCSPTEQPASPVKGSDLPSLVGGLLADAFTSVPVQEAARRIQAAATASAPPPSETAPVSATQDAERPERLTAELIAQSLAPLRTSLRACVQADAAHPERVRLTLMIAPDGMLAAVRAIPETSALCATRALAGHRFPSTRFRKVDSLSYTVDR